MNTHHDIERHLEARQSRRMAAEDRFLSRIERRENAADALVGELIREGRTVFYISTLTRDGRDTGKTREFSRRFEAIAFLLRNGYV